MLCVLPCVNDAVAPRVSFTYFWLVFFKAVEITTFSDGLPVGNDEVLSLLSTCTDTGVLFEAGTIVDVSCPAVPVPHSSSKSK